MGTYYYSDFATSNGNLGDSNNWYNDPGFSSPASLVPVFGDLADIQSQTASSGTVDSIAIGNIPTLGSCSFSHSLVVSGGLFTATTIAGDLTINGSATINGGSYYKGIFNGSVTVQSGSFSGDVTFVNGGTWGATGMANCSGTFTATNVTIGYDPGVTMHVTNCSFGGTSQIYNSAILDANSSTFNSATYGSITSTGGSLNNFASVSTLDLTNGTLSSGCSYTTGTLNNCTINGCTSSGSTNLNGGTMNGGSMATVTAYGAVNLQAGTITSLAFSGSIATTSITIAGGMTLTTMILAVLFPSQSNVKNGQSMGSVAGKSVGTGNYVATPPTVGFGG